MPIIGVGAFPLDTSLPKRSYHAISASPLNSGTTYISLSQSFYPKPRWLLTDQVTKSRHILKTVSCLGENSSSHPASVLVEFEYSVVYGKMFFQQEITDAEVNTSYADC